MIEPSRQQERALQHEPVPMCGSAEPIKQPLQHVARQKEIERLIALLGEPEKARLHGGRHVALGLRHVRSSPRGRAERPSRYAPGWRSEQARRGRLALPQRFPQPFERKIKPGASLITPSGASAIAEQIHHCLCGAVNADSDTLDHVLLDTRGEHLRSEAHELKRQLIDARQPILGADRHPDPRWNRISKPMKRERGGQANDAPWDELGGFRKRMICVERRIRQLVEAAVEAKDQPPSLACVRPLRP